MAITKIEVPELFDFGSDNSAFKLPTGTTAERPTSPSNGEMRFNTTTGYVEYYDTTDAQWWEIDYAPDPFVPSDNFNTVLYQGNGSTQAVTGTAFTPDLVWVKGRSVATSNNLFDSIRGNQRIISNSTGAQVDLNPYAPDGLPSFNSNGFNIGDNFNGDYGLNGDPSGTYGSATGYVAWCWKAGGAPTATNSAGAGNVPTSGSVMIDGVASTAALAGTIAATSISANTAAGFSIISASVPTSGYANTFGHSLNSTPELIIYKPTSITLDWFIFSNYGGSLLGTNNVLRFTTAQASSDSLFVITPTTFKAAATSTAHNFIAYAFHSVAGYSKIGTYTGTGTNGNTIVTGFEPAFVMIKNATDTGGANWVIIDNKRDNADAWLYPNVADAEYDDGNTYTQFNSNGFTVNLSASYVNTSGATYIYMAFAADPT